VLVAGVVHHKVQDDLDVALLGFADQAVEVFERAVLRVHRAIVTDVVAEVHLRRGEHRRQPDGVHTKLLQVIQMLGDAVQIARAVVVTVGKAARIQLVDDRVLPPVGIGAYGFVGMAAATCTGAVLCAAACPGSVATSAASSSPQRAIF